MSDSEVLQPIVIDNGSGYLKAGFAGGEVPKLVLPSYVGRAKYQKVMPTGPTVASDAFVGDVAAQYKGICKLSHPLSHGVVEDWAGMTALWERTYKLLKAVDDQHPVLLTEAPLNPRRNRAKAAQVFFETFNCPALFVQMQPILSLYAAGRTTGVVLDCGDGVSCAVPVFEGFALPHAIQRSDVAGRDVTKHMQTLLRKAGHVFHTSADMDIVRRVKEQLGYLALDAEAEEKKHAQADAPDAAAEFKLPDGSSIKVGSERFRAPEVLFNPSLIGLEYEGVHEMLAGSVAKCDLELRRSMYQEIILSGGSTLTDRFGERLLAEARRLAPKEAKLRIWAPQDRAHSTWVGGSILASLTTFSKMWVTREEYASEGAGAIFRKTF